MAGRRHDGKKWCKTNTVERTQKKKNTNENFESSADDALLALANDGASMLFVSKRMKYLKLLFPTVAPVPAWPPSARPHAKCLK